MSNDNSKQKNMNKGWRWRDDQLTMKEFYNLPQQEKDEYILLILGLKEEERSSMDIILLNRFGKNKLKTNKFLEL
jgi:hypothetical protein